MTGNRYRSESAAPTARLRGNKETKSGELKKKRKGQSRDPFHVPAAGSHRVRQSPAPVCGPTAGALQPDTDSSHWTAPGPDGWRGVPGMDTTTQHGHEFSKDSMGRCRRYYQYSLFCLGSYM